ncbi:hypothetical protein FRX31_027565 [Thalictrum thalictroides]|uniref:Uncharacterized protein n=1 Tax=Thalictrum thalictroides TaxID=46969 RepID=A0A7J6VDM3_THATH|nr:hypothetical protein FRX31_027565 [Thalictrum thalictroides]
MIFQSTIHSVINLKTKKSDVLLILKTWYCAVLEGLMQQARASYLEIQFYRCDANQQPINVFQHINVINTKSPVRGLQQTTLLKVTPYCLLYITISAMEE